MNDATDDDRDERAERIEHIEAWRQVCDAWEKTLPVIDRIDERLQQLGERRLANQLIERAYAVSACVINGQPIKSERDREQEYDRERKVMRLFARNRANAG